MSYTFHKHELKFEFSQEQPDAAPANLELPYDYRPISLRAAGARHPLIIPEDLVDSLSTWAIREGVDSSAVLLAAFKALLYRYTGESQIAVGVQVDIYTAPHLHNSTTGENNVVLVTTEVSGDMNFLDLVRQVNDDFESLRLYRNGADQESPARRATADSVSHDDWPIQLMFSIQDDTLEADRAGGQQPVGTGDGTARCALELEVIRRQSQWACHFRYSTELFSVGTIVRMAGHLEVLLRNITADSRLAELTLLTDREKQQLLHDWNEAHDYPQTRNLHQLFEEQVAGDSGKIALTFDGQEISYGELNRRSNQIAHALSGIHGVARQNVAVMLDNGPQQVAAIFGVLKAGGVFVCLDPEYPTNRLLKILEEAAAPVLVAGQATLNKHAEVHSAFTAAEGQILIVDAQDTESCDEGRHYAGDYLQNQSEENPGIDVQLSDAAYIVYTSGSTGTPKGIMQSHRSFCQFIEWQSKEFQIVAGERFVQWASIGYDASYCEIFGTLCFGGTLCMAPPGTRFNPGALLEWVRRERATILQMVPSFCRQVLELLEAEEREEGENPLPDVRILLLAGEILPVDLARAWLTLSPDPPTLVNLYGPTESVLATYCRVDSVDDNTQSIPIGKAIDGRQILILDKDKNLCPVGVRGELYIRSQYLVIGYWGLPEETAARIIQNPLHNEFDDPVYRTGDTARWRHDGNIEFIGRSDNLVKLNGMRVELGDIESALRQFEGIKNCAVIVRTLAPKNTALVAKERTARAEIGKSAKKILGAYFTSDRKISSQEIRAFLEENLPVHMIPQQLVQLDELPLNANRKLDIRSLPDPASLRRDLKQPFVAPSNQVESLIAEVWRDVLGLDRVGVNDRFFELGGDSLSAIQILNRIRDSVGSDVSFFDLFSSETVAGLAELVASKAGKTIALAPAAFVSQQRSVYPLTLAQQGIWFLWKLDPDNPYYTAQGSIHLAGHLDLPAIRRAWQALVNRHCILRARFDTRDGQPVQIFDERPQVQLGLTDLTDLPVSDRRPRLDELARQKGQIAVDLEKDELFQAEIFKLADHEHDVVITFHEIILDLWGLSVMIKDLGMLYEREITGDPGTLTPPEFQFSDFAVWEQGNIRKDLLVSERGYWQEELSGELPILNLPTDRRHPALPTYRGAARSVLLDTELTRQLKELSTQENATLFATLMAAINVLLRTYAGQDDIIIGAPHASRAIPETERLVGFFLNMLPIRTDTADDPSFRNLLQRVRKSVRGAIGNGKYPFAWMLENVDAVRDTSVSPVFQVMLNMLNLPHMSVEAGGLNFTFSELDTGYIKYDLAFYAQEQDDQLFFQIAYLKDLFDAETIDRMLNNFVVLLKNIVARPESAISALQLLDERERHKLLFDFNDTRREFDTESCIHVAFECQARKTPEATAFIYEDEQICYRDLNQRANRLARHLRRAGVTRETRVAICMERGFDMIVGMLGIMKAGGTYVALEETYPDLRLRDILQDTDPSVLLLNKSLDRFDGFGGKKVFIDADWCDIEQEDETNLDCISDPADIMKIIYTSSSTGKPKGTLIPMSAILNRFSWMWHEYPFQEGDCILLQKSYALVAAAWECFGALLQGIPTLILSKDDLSDPVDLWEKLVKHRVTHTYASPAFYEGILDQGEKHMGQWQTLRFATTSASPTPPSMIARWRAVFPGVPLLNLYGATECSSNVTAYDTVDYTSDHMRVPIGKPLANTRVYVLDKQMQLVPIGVTGEMCVAGACLAKGYLNKPQLTSDCFGRDPFSDDPDSQLYRTGDLARFANNGNLEIAGRRDNQVKIRGFRVELGDVEEVLALHEIVNECALDLLERQENRSTMVAYVVCKIEPDRLTIDTLRGFLRERLPEYMVPSDFVFVERLPLTPNGKVDRKSLSQLQNLLLEETVGDELAPETETQKIIAAIWCDKLGCDSVKLPDNFFDLGGYSLLAAEVTYEIEKNLGPRFSPTALIVNTLAQLAAKCDEHIEILRKNPVEKYGIFSKLKGIIWKS